MGLLLFFVLFNFFLLFFLFAKVELYFLLLWRNGGKSGMVFKEFGLNFFHQFYMIIVELSFSSLEVAIIWQFSKIQILSGKTFAINDALTKVLDLVNLIDLLGKLSDGLFHFILLFDEFHQWICIHSIFLKKVYNLQKRNQFLESLCASI